MLSRDKVINNFEIKPFDMPVLDAAVIEQSDKTDNKVDETLLQQKIEMLEREAYERGFEVGERAGLEMAEEKAKVLIRRLESIIEELISAKERLLKGLEPQIIELAIGIAKKIILKELEIDHTHIVDMTREAMKRLERIGQITIKINPALYEIFNRCKPDLLSVHPDILFDVDPTVSVNGSVVISSSEEVVTDLDEQIRNIIFSIKENIER